MDDDRRTLSPASHEDLVHSLSYALRYNRAGKRVSDRDSITANAAAEHLAQALKLSGYVVMKKPPLSAHSAPPPPHAHLYDPERFKKPEPED